MHQVAAAATRISHAPQVAPRPIKRELSSGLPKQTRALLSAEVQAVDGGQQGVQLGGAVDGADGLAVGVDDAVAAVAQGVNAVVIDARGHQVVDEGGVRVAVE